MAGMRLFVGVTTVLSLASVWAANLFLTQRGSTGLDAFVPNAGQHVRLNAHTGHAIDEDLMVNTETVGSARETIGAHGLIAFGMGFGLLAGIVHHVRPVSKLAMRAAGAGIEVAEKTASAPVPYLKNLPRTIIEKRTLDKLLAAFPREQWDNPPEDSYLYTLKLYAETYGEGKATKMGWWDFWYMRINLPDELDFFTAEELAEADAEWRLICSGKVPMWLPGPAGLFWPTSVIQWRGPEMFAGDQIQTVVTNGGWAVQYINNMAFYREGLKPWQRGIEIGMAHGYFIIGPFVSLGPLRNTPEAATVGLIAGAALIGLVSVGGLLFGSLIKPKLFDKSGDLPGSGFQEMINWHAIGGLGGAGFAHFLITVFGSG